MSIDFILGSLGWLAVVGSISFMVGAWHYRWQHRNRR